MSVSRKRGDDETIIQRIVEAVGTATDTRPLELSPPLYDVIDPDALIELTRNHTGTDLEVTFPYHGCRVAVDATGQVEASSLGTITSSGERISRDD